MPTPKKNNKSMQNAAERLIADIANNPSAYMEGDSMDKLKFLLDGMSRGKVLADGSQRASDEVSTIIREYRAPSYHREAGMTPRTVGSVNRGQVGRMDPTLGVTMDYPYTSQERQRLEDVKADEMNEILADLVRNPPRKTVGEGYKNGGTVKYRSGSMMKYAQYMSGGRIYAENGDRVPEASADPLKSPAVQASIEKLLSPYRDQIDYIRQQRSKYGSNDPAVRNFNIRPAYAALEGAGEGDVDLLRSLISMDPTNREEAAQKSKAIEFAQSVSDEYAREMGTPVRNPLYNFFGLEGGPKYNNGGTVKYRSGGVMKYENGGPLASLLRNLEQAPEGMGSSGEEFIAMQADPTREAMKAYKLALRDDPEYAEALDSKYNVRNVKFRPFTERQEDMFGGKGAIPRMPSEHDFAEYLPRDVMEDDEKRRAYMNTPEFKKKAEQARRSYEMAMDRFGLDKQRFIDTMKARGVDTDIFNENFFRFDDNDNRSSSYDTYQVR